MSNTGPVQLLAVDPDGKLSINQAAARQLSNIRDPVTVIGIVGKYRTGKSFLMNQLLGKCSGFSLGPTVQSHTKGVWMWLSSDQDGHKLLLDTEGQNDIEGNDDRSLQIYVLLVILSGCLLVNCNNVIDDSIFQLLELVGRLSEVLSDSLNDGGSEIRSVFPPLFLVVRDFFLDLTIDGSRCTADEYLENCLKEKRSHKPEVDRRNELRSTLKDLFPIRHCFTLPRPIKDDEKLQNVDHLQPSELDTKFRDQTAKLCKTVHRVAKPKLFRGNGMTGIQIAHLLEECVTAFRQGRIPSLQTTFESLADAECKKGLGLVMQAYKIHATDICKDMPMSEDQLQKRHTMACEDSCRLYSQFAHFDHRSECFKEMELNNEHEVLVHANEKVGIEYCRTMLYELYHVNVKMKIQDGAYNHVDGPTEYIQDYQTVLEWYAQRPQDVPDKCAAQVLEEFEEERQAEQFSIAHNAEQIGQKENEIATHEQLLCLERENREEAEGMIEQLTAQMVEMQRSNQEQLRVTTETLQTRHSEHVQAVASAHQREVATYTRAAGELQNRLEEKHRETLRLQRELERTRTSNHQAEQERLTLERQNRQLETALAQINSSRRRSSRRGCIIS